MEPTTEKKLKAAKESRIHWCGNLMLTDKNWEKWKKLGPRDCALCCLFRKPYPDTLQCKNCLLSVCQKSNEGCTMSYQHAVEAENYLEWVIACQEMIADIDKYIKWLEDGK